MRNRYWMILAVLLLLTSCAPVPSATDASKPKNPASLENSENSHSPDSTEPTNKRNFAKITVYNGTVCEIKEDGTLVMWGSNVFGGIGNGEINEIHSSPEEFHPIDSYTHTFDERIVDAGSMVSSYALTEKGNVYTWGLNQNGECGTKTTPILLPQKVEELRKIKQFSMETAYSLALGEDGTVYHAGIKMEQFSTVREYGWSDSLEMDIDKNDHFTKLPLNFKSIKVASNFAYVFLTDTAEVYMQGLLLGDALSQSPDIRHPEPVKIEFPEKIVDIAALSTNIVAVSESGKVYVYGRPRTGLSDAGTDIKISDLIYQKHLEDVVAVDGSEYCVMAVTANGDGYAWGLDIHGQIHKSNEGKPRGEYEIVSEPVKLDYSNIKQFTMGVLSGSVLDETGNLFIWGDSSSGQLLGLEK